MLLLLLLLATTTTRLVIGPDGHVVHVAVGLYRMRQVVEVFAWVADDPFWIELGVGLGLGLGLGLG